MKCLDSTFLIDLLKNDEGAIKKAEETEKAGLMATTEINVFEIASGIELSKLGDKNKLQRMDQASALINRVHTFPLDRESALRAAKIIGQLKKNGSMIDTLDALVAGISLAHGCDVVVTRNVKHFKNIKGLKVETY